MKKINFNNLSISKELLNEKLENKKLEKKEKNGLNNQIGLIL